MLWIQIRIRIRMFLGLPDLHPDPFVTIHQAKMGRKNLIFYCFVTSLRLFTTVPDPYVFGPPGSASGSVRQRYGSEDPDPY